MFIIENLVVHHTLTQDSWVGILLVTRGKCVLLLVIELLSETGCACRGLTYSDTHGMGIIGDDGLGTTLYR